MGVAIWKRIGKVLDRLDTVDQDFASAFTHLESITERLDAMSQQLDTLTAQVKANKDLTQSAVTLIQGLAAKIESLKDDPVALQQLADDLKAQDATLAGAIQANTPAPQPVPASAKHK